MASVTSNPFATGPLANRLPGAQTLRIEPPSGWFELRRQELWSFRELLFFLVWRDVKVRCHRRFLGNRAAAAHHARRHSHFWQARQIAVPGAPLFRLLLCRASALDLFLTPFCVCRNRHPLSFWRAFVFQSHGRQHRGQSVETQMRAWLSQSKDQRELADARRGLDLRRNASFVNQRTVCFGLRFNSDDA